MFGALPIERIKYLLKGGRDNTTKATLGRTFFISKKYHYVLSVQQDTIIYLI
jgi:hypothetical protein